MLRRERSRLREENRRLRRENEYLRYRLGMLGERMGAREETPFSDRFSERSRVAAASHRRTYFGYLLGRVRQSPAFRLWDRTRFAVRGFFFVSRLWRLSLWFFTLLGLGTQLVLIVGALAVLIPAAALVSLFLGIFGFFSYRRRRREVAAMLSESPPTRIYLVFMPRGRSERAYFRAVLADMEREGLVFLVCRSFRACGFRGFYRESRGCVRIHMSCYFSLRRLLLAQRVIYIY